VRNKFFSYAEAGTRVGRQVDTRSEGTNLERYIVGNDDELAALGVFWCLCSDDPRHHADCICARLAVDLNNFVVLIKNKLT